MGTYWLTPIHRGKLCIFEALLPYSLYPSADEKRMLQQMEHLEYRVPTNTHNLGRHGVSLEKKTTILITMRRINILYLLCFLTLGLNA